MSSVVVESSADEPVGWRLAFTGAPVRPPKDFHPLVEQWADIADRERRLHLPVGTPILVRPQGDLDYRLVQYLTRDVEFTDLAVTSQATYARQLQIWFNFIWDTEECDWDEATTSTFLAFRTFRMFTGGDRDRVSPTTFKNSLPPLRAFYVWAIREGHVAESPIPKKTLKGAPGVEPKDVRSSRERWVIPRTYMMWRNVGLLDCSAELDYESSEVRSSGTRTSGARGRNQIRNIAYTDLLLTSALRNRELSHLLLPELPANMADDVMLPSAVAKGGHERVWSTLSPHPLVAVDRYIRTVRRAQVVTAQARGRYDGPDWIIASAIEQGRSLVLRNGARRSLESFTVAERPKLVLQTEHGLEPLMVWLNETGEPMFDRSWGNVFTRANNRVDAEYRRLGVRSTPPRISAHSLRFTCALFTLLAQVQVIDERLGLSPVEPWVESRYIEAFDYVKDLLGHADVQVTKDYYLKPVRTLRRANVLGADRTLTSLMDWLAQESALMANPKVQL